MGTKGITKDTKFYIRVINPEYDLEIDDSEEYSIELMAVCDNGIQKALDNGNAISYKNEFGAKITIPYKILKNSIIKLITL
jgi:hypothetical protein